MNFQNSKLASHARSAGHGNGRNRFAAAVLLFGMVFFPAASAHAESDFIWLKGHRAYFLVSKPLSHVKAKLEKSLATNPDLKGFKASDGSARLSDMDDFSWMYVAVSHRPEVHAALNRQIKAIFATALTAGVITAEEQTRFEQAITQSWTLNGDAVKNTPFFSQRIARWSYKRRRGTPHRYNDDYIRIMDISPLLGRAPVTLVSFNSNWTRITTQGETNGDVQFPDLQNNTKGEKSSDRRLNGLMRLMAKMAKRMPILSKADTQDAMRTDPVGTSGREEADPDSVDITTTPAIDVQGSDLPADEDHIRPDSDRRPAWQMLALPDGSVLASGLAAHRFVQRETEVKRLDAEPGLYALDDLKIDPAGTVWGHGATSYGARFFQSWSPTSESASTYQVCNPEERSALPFELSLDQIRQTCNPRYSGDWVVQPGQGIAFRSGADLFALDKVGKWTHRTWNEGLRQSVWRALISQCWVGNNPIQFGDGLFWRRDYDGYGVDPTTARVAQTVVPSTVFFGSLSAGWGLGFSTWVDWFDRSISQFSSPLQFRVKDLTTGKPRLDVKTGAPDDHFSNIRYSVARSAHGRLLAISDASSGGLAIVLDMKEGKPLATLRVPQDYEIDAMAFSWQGDKLWLYARKAEVAGGRKMIVWDIPANLTDAAQGMDVPDQLRFKFVRIYSFGGRCF